MYDNSRGYQEHIMAMLKHLLDNGGHVESPAMCAQTVH